MLTSSVLDILIYVFDRYMLDEVLEEVPERSALERQLEYAGFAQSHVVRALDWLEELARMRDRPPLAAVLDNALRIYDEGELSYLSTECRGFLLKLERAGILSVQQREIVIERLLALGAEELSQDQVKWVVLMVLSSQPGQEHAFAQLENLVTASDLRAPH